MKERLSPRRARGSGRENVLLTKELVSTREEKAAGGKEYSESPELKILRRKFLASHGASYVANMAVLLTSVWYAVGIAGDCL